MRTLSVAIVGVGVIGMDLLRRISETDGIRLELIIGRAGTRRLYRLRERGYQVSDRGLVKELDDGRKFDVIFDATDACSHREHWERACTADSLVVDLTPSHVGTPIVPVVNMGDVRISRNINMVSCAGQASIPMISGLMPLLKPNYVEVTATAANASFGPAAKRNVNEFIENTGAAIRELTGAASAKFMAGVSPCRPAPDFRLSVSLAGNSRLVPDDRLKSAIVSIQDRVRDYAPGYSAELIRCDKEVVTVDVTVRATAPAIPSCAGNLEIINGAAVRVVQHYGSLLLEGAMN